jgi:zinc protease
MKHLWVLLLMAMVGCAGNSAAVSADRADRDITVRLTVPDTGWSIVIQEIYQTNGELAVISQLSRSKGMAAQMITTVSDTARVNAPDLPVKHYVVGKTWGWQNAEPYIFIKSVDELDADVLQGMRLYPQKGGDGD